MADGIVSTILDDDNNVDVRFHVRRPRDAKARVCAPGAYYYNVASRTQTLGENGDTVLTDDDVHGDIIVLLLLLLILLR